MAGLVLTCSRRRRDHANQADEHGITLKTGSPI